ncbi:hypothetical protein [Rodentibacter haemolyticus]|uniref:Uncharacterized protein n=1 Tax=Rodentibacter haemolyticus TaxID=2778911 RepID=A0ABX6UZW4_9PAST|nr:hypothetical protein [Rodentibacter haemolyticus]QPB42840.1 hypothetical protein IHV77_01570 [Rodentibacter haemolyticus]
MYSLTPKEQLFFNDEEKYWEKHLQSKHLMGIEELENVAQSAINGGVLIRLLGMENAVERG